MLKTGEAEKALMKFDWMCGFGAKRRVEEEVEAAERPRH
jgi:hypothetical protein